MFKCLYCEFIFDEPDIALQDSKEIKACCPNCGCYEFEEIEENSGVDGTIDIFNQIAAYFRGIE